MKKLSLLCLICIFTACKHNVENVENPYCINLVKNSWQTSTVSASEMDTIKYLFSQNNFDYTKYLFTRFHKEEEFGYYDLNVGDYNTDENYVKAWKITSKTMNRIVAYINDETSEIIYYFDGIIVDPL